MNFIQLQKNIHEKSPFFCLQTHLERYYEAVSKKPEKTKFELNVWTQSQQHVMKGFVIYVLKDATELLNIDR